MDEQIQLPRAFGQNLFAVNKEMPTAPSRIDDYSDIIEAIHYIIKNPQDAKAIALKTQLQQAKSKSGLENEFLYAKIYFNGVFLAFQPSSGKVYSEHNKQALDLMQELGLIVQQPEHTYAPASLRIQQSRTVVDSQRGTVKDQRVTSGAPAAIDLHSATMQRGDMSRQRMVLAEQEKRLAAQKVEQERQAVEQLRRLAEQERKLAEERKAATQRAEQERKLAEERQRPTSQRATASTQHHVACAPAAPVLKRMTSIGASRQEQGLVLSSVSSVQDLLRVLERNKNRQSEVLEKLLLLDIPSAKSVVQLLNQANQIGFTYKIEGLQSGLQTIREYVKANRYPFLTLPRFGGRITFDETVFRGQIVQQAGVAEASASKSAAVVVQAEERKAATQIAEEQQRLVAQKAEQERQAVEQARRLAEQERKLAEERKVAEQQRLTTQRAEQERNARLSVLAQKQSSHQEIQILLKQQALLLQELESERDGIQEYVASTRTSLLKLERLREEEYEAFTQLTVPSDIEASATGLAGLQKVISKRLNEIAKHSQDLDYINLRIQQHSAELAQLTQQLDEVKLSSKEEAELQRLQEEQRASQQSESAAPEFDGFTPVAKPLGTTMAGLSLQDQFKENIGVVNEQVRTQEGHLQSQIHCDARDRTSFAGRVTGSSSSSIHHHK